MSGTLCNVPSALRTIWIFKIDLPALQIAAFNDETYNEDGDMVSWPLRDALGAHSLDHDGIEVFDVKDLAEIGLAEYLWDANGMNEADVKPMTPQLDTLKGHVLLVHSMAFNGREANMAPQSPLRHIATFSEPQPRTTLARLEAESAKGNVASAPAQTATATSARSGSLVLGLVALIVAALVITLIAKVLL